MVVNSYSLADEYFLNVPDCYTVLDCLPRISVQLLIINWSVFRVISTSFLASLSCLFAVLDTIRRCQITPETTGILGNTGNAAINASFSKIFSEHFSHHWLLVSIAPGVRKTELSCYRQLPQLNISRMYSPTKMLTVFLEFISSF